MLGNISYHINQKILLPAQGTSRFLAQGGGGGGRGGGGGILKSRDHNHVKSFDMLNDFISS